MRRIITTVAAFILVALMVVLPMVTSATPPNEWIYKTITVDMTVVHNHSIGVFNNEDCVSDVPDQEILDSIRLGDVKDSEAVRTNVWVRNTSQKVIHLQNRITDNPNSLNVTVYPNGVVRLEPGEVQQYMIIVVLPVVTSPEYKSFTFIFSEPLDSIGPTNGVPFIERGHTDSIH